MSNPDKDEILQVIEEEMTAVYHKSYDAGFVRGWWVGTLTIITAEVLLWLII